MHRIDTRGMSCPQPVLMTKKALQSGLLELDVVVDNNTALGNVTRYLNSQGFSKVSTTADGADTIIHAAK